MCSAISLYILANFLNFHAYLWGKHPLSPMGHKNLEKVSYSGETMAKFSKILYAYSQPFVGKGEIA